MKRPGLALLLFILCLQAAVAQYVVLPADSIPLTSPKGRQLLLESSDNAGYWQISPRYVSQSSQANCGPASAVMVLNALGVNAPLSTMHPPYHEFDQDNFFSPGTEAVLPKATLEHQGATLAQLADMLRAYGLTVEVHHASDSSPEQFRREARTAVSASDRAVIINYRRAELSQEGGGHFSPLGAYHESDRFLVMDPARYKYPPWWTFSDALFRSMNTPDTTSGKTRGYLLVQRQP